MDFRNIFRNPKPAVEGGKILVPSDEPPDPNSPRAKKSRELMETKWPGVMPQPPLEEGE